MSNQVIDALFQTNAIRVAPQQTPFWYTSGTLGPFYINTHFLIKDEATAGDFLKKIETYIAEDKLTMPKKLFLDLLKMYETCDTFKMITDLLTEKLSEYEFDFISGGERRDYFFSILPSFFLCKPHLSIFKDNTACYSTENFEKTVLATEVDLKGKKAIHVADLITEASSYVRAWIPVIRGLGADITQTVAIIDRHQGGKENLAKLGCEMFTFAGIDKSLFEVALNSGTINQKQMDLVLSFLESPTKYMEDFLKANPSFIQDQINLGGKNKDRALLAIEKGHATL